MKTSRRHVLPIAMVLSLLAGLAVVTTTAAVARADEPAATIELMPYSARTSNGQERWASTFDPVSINGDGLMVGTTRDANWSSTGPALWNGTGDPVPVTLPAGALFPNPVQVFDNGSVLLTGTKNGKTAFFRSDGPQAVEYESGDADYLQLYDATADGRALGQQAWFPREGGNPTYLAVEWFGGGPPTAIPGVTSAYALNERGDVLQRSGGATQLVRAAGGTVGLPGGVEWSLLNDEGEVAGWVDGGSVPQLARWDGSVTYTGIPGRPIDLNDEGALLYNAPNDSSSRLLLADGTVHRLKDMLDPSVTVPDDWSAIGTQTGWQTLNARDMNDSCQIVGTGSYVYAHHTNSFGNTVPLTQTLGFRLNVGECKVDPLSVSWTELPAVAGGAELEVPFPVTARVTNRGTAPVTGLRLRDGVGLLSTPGIEVLEGPRWSEQTTLAPDESVEISYLLRSTEVGTEEIELAIAGETEEGAVSASDVARIQVAPPVDVAVTSGQSEDTELGDEFNVSVKVTNEWDEAVTHVRPDSLTGPVPAAISIVDGPRDPDGVDARTGTHRLAAGEAITFTYRVRLEADYHPAELTALVTLRDEATGTTFFRKGTSGSDGDLIVELDGVGQRGNTFEVELIVRNDGEQPLTDLELMGDDGIEYQPEVYEVEDRAEVVLVEGPVGELPDALGPGEHARTSFILEADEPGRILVVGRVQAEGGLTETVRSQASVEVTIDRCDRSVEALQECLAESLGEALAEAHGQMFRVQDSVVGAHASAHPAAALPRAALGPVHQTIRAAEPTMGEKLLQMLPAGGRDAVEVVTRGAPVYFSETVTGVGQVLGGTVDAVKAVGGGYLNNFVLVTPEVRNENVRRVLDFAATEAGYQVTGMQPWVDAYGHALDGDMDEATRIFNQIQEQNDVILGEAVVWGEQGIAAGTAGVSAWATLAAQDPVEAGVQMLETAGRAQGIVLGLIAENVIGGRVIRAMNGRSMFVRSADEVADLGTPTKTGKAKRGKGDDPDGTSGPKSAARPNRVEDLPVDLDITAEALAELINGHPADVQDEFHRIIGELEDEFDLELQIEARTAEAEGLVEVLEGRALAKEQWNKAKSTNILDTTYLNGPVELAGKAAFYPPKPDWPKINALPNGALKNQVLARLEVQKKNWFEWSGEVLDNDGNVTRTVAEPSETRRFFDQGRSPEGAVFENKLFPKYAGPEGQVIQSTKVLLGEPVEVDLGGGRRAVSPIDRASGKPWGADVDIFSVTDARTGQALTGSLRSKVYLSLWNKLERSKIPFGRHGWTFDGSDLTAKLSHVRAQELMRVQDPADAAAFVERYPEAFFKPGEQPTPAEVEAMKRKVGAGEFVIKYKRSSLRVGFGALPKVPRLGL